MKQIKLAGTALEVSQLCFGTAGFGKRIDKETAFLMLDKFTEAGGNFIDTAAIYALDSTRGVSLSEETIGLYLKARPGTNLVVATKGAHYDLSTKEKRVNRRCIETDLDTSLRLLGLDKIDLYWLHRDDPDMPIEEIIDIMEILVKAGKIEYYGASNYSTQRLQKAKKYAKSIGAKGFSAVSDYWTPLTENPGHPLSADTTLVGCTKDDLEELADMALPLIPFSSTAKGWVAKGREKASEKLNLCFDNETNNKFRLMIQEKAEQENCPVQTALLRYMWEYGKSIGLQIIPITACSSIEQVEELIKF